MNLIKKWYAILTEKPITREEIDAKVGKAVSDAWRKKILETP